MHRGLGWLVGVTVAALVAPASALAGNLCVPNNMIPACGGVGANENTIANAVTNASPHDTIYIGAGSYPETVSDGGKQLTFIGAGAGQTVIQGQNAVAMTISPGSLVSSLTVDLANGTSHAGLSLGGNATYVAVTATQPGNTSNNIGVALNGGAFTQGTITLPLTGIDANGFAGVVGPGQITDSSIQAAVGVGPDISNNFPTLRRDRIVANQGVLVGSVPVTLDDLLIHTVPGSKAEIGLGMSGSDMAADFTARHLTIVGSGSAASIGVQAAAVAFSGPQTTSMRLASSIVRGYVTSIFSEAAGSFPATSTVTVDHSFYDPATQSINSAGAMQVATITPDAASGNRDPLFVNPAAGDYHLQAGSPAIDAGDPAALAAGESTTDLDAAARLVAGHAGDAPIGDVGAFEFVPHAPSVSASAAPQTVAPGRAAQFTATGSDPSPGDAVSLRWAFDDGGSATGSPVLHSFTRAGRHRATVTATDLDGFTASTSVFVTVPGPQLSKLSVKTFTVGGKTTISYVDSQAATTTFAVLRTRGNKVLGTFTHKDRAGRNSFRWNGHLGRKALAAGHYRLRAIPRNGAGTGPAVIVSFQVRKAARHRHHR